MQPVYKRLLWILIQFTTVISTHDYFLQSAIAQTPSGSSIQTRPVPDKNEPQFSPGVVISRIDANQNYWLDTGLMFSQRRLSADNNSEESKSSRTYRRYESDSMITYVKGGYLRAEHALLVRQGSLWLVEKGSGAELFPLMHDLDMRGFKTGDRFTPKQTRSHFLTQLQPSVDQRVIALLVAAYELGFGGLTPTHLYGSFVGK